MRALESMALPLVLVIVTVLGCWVPFTAAFVAPSFPNPCWQPHGITRVGSGVVKRPASSSRRILHAADGTELDKSNLTVDMSTREAQELLVEALGFHNASSAAVALLEQLRGLPADQSAAVLDGLLRSGPDAPLPFWTRFRLLARVSKRARFASLKRTLQVTTPPPSSTSSEQPPQQQQQRPQQRPRALLALLRSLASLEEEPTFLLKRRRRPAICILEQKARRASREIQADVLRQRLPPGLETPSYEVVATLGPALEIRTYQPYAVCAVSMTRPRPDHSEATDAKLPMPQLAGAGSFGALAGYLFGKNDQATAMKMTTPVFTTTTTVPASSGDKQMEFVLPSSYWQQGISQAPQPLPGSGVILQQVNSETRAVVMFGGYASQTEVTNQKAQLKAALQRNRDWTMVSDDTDLFALAQYNDPFTVPWRRLNEVSVPVMPSTKATVSN